MYKHISNAFSYGKFIGTLLKINPYMLCLSCVTLNHLLVYINLTCTQLHGYMF